MNYLKIITIICISSSLMQCALTEGLGVPTYGAYSGKEAKEKIGNAILEAESLASAYWLSQSGMRGGLGPIAPLLVVNGLLAQALFPFVFSIKDSAQYKMESVDKCAEDIKTKGAIALGSGYETLPPGGITGIIRDASLLPQLAGCELEETSDLINLPGGLEL